MADTNKLNTSKKVLETSLLGDLCLSVVLRFITGGIWFCCVVI